MIESKMAKARRSRAREEASLGKARVPLRREEASLGKARVPPLRREEASQGTARGEATTRSAHVITNTTTETTRPAVPHTNRPPIQYSSASLVVVLSTLEVNFINTWKANPSVCGR